VVSALKGQGVSPTTRSRAPPTLRLPTPRLRAPTKAVSLGSNPCKCTRTLKGPVPLGRPPLARARRGVNRPRGVNPPLTPPLDGPRHCSRLLDGVAKPRRRRRQVALTTMAQRTLATPPPRPRVLSLSDRPRPRVRTRRPACAGTPQHESRPHSASCRPHARACALPDGRSRHRPTATPNGAGPAPLRGSRRQGGYTRSGLCESEIAQSGAVIPGSLRDGSNLALEVCSISSPVIGNYHW